MPGATKCRRRHVLSALVFFLVLTSARTSRLESSSGAAFQTKSRGLQGPAGDRKTLLDLLLKALVDSSSFQAASSQPFKAERVIVRRFTNGGAHYSSAALDREAKVSSSSTSRERAPRFLAASRHSEVFPRDSSLKDKFIKHFTGPVTFSAECSKHFHRLYHNTRDCSTPAYYKRCARLLTRLAMSPLCTQS
ncbi:ALK and LTK ligand 1 isoform X1 [Ahaetulla prasina]|uniref:ALK and LTK ligand 1 isoform X1 n=2 Tax=Ahaetulla prasina TaxID=499056 RepID=UPI0026475587|nr:ALK and LTK ligand 1 isoform X1 [Ahaetulla prasina]XP_058032772.1 ALK and LTK ligand 1 isoform X1 [Ahaetulla prasina]